jgi:hypothetical protein
VERGGVPDVSDRMVLRSKLVTMPCDNQCFIDGEVEGTNVLPKLGPPPFKAQNKSEFCPALAFVIVPFARTI